MVINKVLKRKIHINIITQRLQERSRIVATILNDVEIKRLIGTVIVDGDPLCIRPNAYVLRLGSKGEFLNTGKEFELA